VKKVLLLLALLAANCAARAQYTPTPNLGLQIPANGSTNWNNPLNYNFNLLDQLIGGTVQNASVGLALKSVFASGTPTISCAASNQGQFYYNTAASYAAYACNGGAWVAVTAGAGAVFTPSAIQYATSPTASRAVAPSDIASLLSVLTNCSTSGYAYSPANNACVSGGAVLPASGLVASTNATTGRQASVADVAGVLYGGTTGGVANAYAITLSPVPAAINVGVALTFKPVAANTITNPTLAVGPASAATIVKQGGGALAAGDLSATAIANVIWDGTNWELQNPQTAVSGATFTANAIQYGTNATTSRAVTGADLATIVTGTDSSGTANVYTVALSPAPASIVTGFIVNFLPHAANTSSAPTLAVSPGSATAIVKTAGATLSNSDMLSTIVARAQWNGSNWVLLNPQTSAAGISTLTSDVSATGTGSVAATVQGLKTVPFCTGYTPANGQAVEYTTASSPNPCYTAATPSGAPAGTQTQYVGYVGTIPTAIDPTQASSAVAPQTAVSNPQPTATMATSGWSGYLGFGHSFVFGTGATSCANASSTCYFWKLAAATGNGSQATNYGVVGDQAVDTVKKIFNNDSATNSDNVLRTLDVALNDADNQVPFAYMENFNLAHIAAMTWEGIYAANKSLGQSQTPATNWSTNTTYAKDTFLVTSTYNAPQVWTVPYTANGSWPAYASGPHLIMWYAFADVGCGSGMLSGAPGVFTVAGLGNTVAVNSATSIPMLSSNGTCESIGYLDLGTIGGATRTLSITVTMTSASGNVGIGGFGYSDPLINCTSAAASPCLWVAGVSRLLASSAGNAQSTSTYNQQVQANVQYLNSIGYYNVYFVNTRNFFTNIASTMNADGKHPNDSGHATIANGFLAPTAIPTTTPTVDASLQQLRTITSATNCQLSSTDSTVLFNVTGGTAISCLLPAPSVFTNAFIGTSLTSKRITLTNVQNGIITFTSATGETNAGTAVGYQLGPNQVVTIEKDYSTNSGMRWNAVNFDPNFDLTCKVVSLPYTVLDNDTDKCLVTGSNAGGVFTYPTSNTTSRHHIFIDAATAPTANITFAGTGLAGNGLTQILVPGGSMETVARTATTIDVVSETSFGGFIAPTVVTTTHTLGYLENYLTLTAAGTLVVTLPTTWPASKVATLVNQGTAALTYTGASSGTANALVTLPGQVARLDYEGSGAWYGANLAPAYFTSGSLGGSALTAGTCSSVTVAVAGSTVGMRATANPSTYPGDGTYWYAYVSAAGTVTVKVCASAASVTPTSSTYNVGVN